MQPHIFINQIKMIHAQTLRSQMYPRPTNFDKGSWTKITIGIINHEISSTAIDTISNFQIVYMPKIMQTHHKLDKYQHLNWVKNCIKLFQEEICFTSVRQVAKSYIKQQENNYKHVRLVASVKSSIRVPGERIS